MEGRGPTWHHLSECQPLGRRAPMHSGWPKLSRLQPHTPSFGASGWVGQVYISPNELYKVGGRGKEKVLTQKLEERSTGVSARGRNSQESGLDAAGLGQGTEAGFLGLSEFTGELGQLCKQLAENLPTRGCQGDWGSLTAPDFLPSCRKRRQ